MAIPGVLLLVLLVVPGFVVYAVIPRILYLCGSLIGWRIQKHSLERKQFVLESVREECKQFEDAATVVVPEDGEWEKVDGSKSQSEPVANAHSEADRDWEGIIGFFHPFCNAGGGGERVLWAAIRATQRRWPRATCAVYTGDHDVSKDDILKRVHERFNINLHPPTVVFLYLSTRHYVLASTWPHFTLLGQSIGSLVLASDAFAMLVPDVFIDTMGYAFSLALSKFLFPNIPTAAYVHYPTISTDMLGSLDEDVGSSKGINAGAGKGWKGFAKRLYWHMFAALYGWAGGSVDIVMTNSSWTQRHIQELWGPSRKRKRRLYAADVVFPPCAVQELEREVDVSEATEQKREPVLLYIAQFRPEKNHQLIINAFAALMRKIRSGDGSAPKKARLVLLGSVRNDSDETHVYSLRLLAHELHVAEHVDFVLNTPWKNILSHLRTASVGVNAMWNEHFGIGVVEYLAAGLISVVNDSGGPKMDIVVDEGEGPTGYHASSEADYAHAFDKALSLGTQQALEMRLRARKRAKMFDEDSFERRWIEQSERLMEMRHG